STLNQLNLAQIIPLLSVYGLAFFRLMPAFNRMLFSYNQILFLTPSLDAVYRSFTIQTEPLGNQSIAFKSMIHVDAVSFSYPSAPTKQILKRQSIEIPYQSSIGIMGSSGSGKSTLLDIICGLIAPDSGQVCIDGIPLSSKTIRSWRASIGYVTQETTLFDNTVGYNIAFGHPYDETRIVEVLHAVKLYDFFNIHDGVHTIIGENGCRLSGGQRQRIGVARALYHNPQLLILDEATSALDKDTEQHLIDEVFSKLTNQTIISVSHHAAALEYCDQIHKL
ncbi:MAG: ATP-binding cassette domain-containing protein, partial [Flavobacteriaceae bacterium]|nr:ATP-binding cassette domain-containing protein [Flavobacteriaceae bacterium]